MIRPVVALAGTALLLVACDRSPARTAREATVRPPTREERAALASTIRAIWNYEAEPPGSVAFFYRVHLRRPPFRPKIVSARISRVDARYASVAVELRDPRGKRRGGAAVVVLEKDDHPDFGRWGYPVAGPAVSFPLSCTSATPKPLRDLLCPSPWSVLRYPRPRVRAQSEYTQRVPSTDLHAIDWRKVTLPGGACGSSRPIRFREARYGPRALIRPDVDLLWWNPVVVSSWSRRTFGDLDGDGRDEAALQISCANGGGTAAGQLAFSAVVFKALGRSMRVVGIVTPRQPLDPQTAHVPLIRVTKIARGRVMVSEAWYGPFDGSCCASGRARTVWRYSRGKLRPARTSVVQQPWTSPLHIYDVVVEPGTRELSPFALTRLVAGPNLRFIVTVNNEGDATRQNVQVTLRLAQPSGAIVKTKTIRRIRSWPDDPPAVIFRNFGPLRLQAKTTLTIEIAGPGTNPLRYRVLFARG